MVMQTAHNQCDESSVHKPDALGRFQYFSFMLYISTM